MEENTNINEMLPKEQYTFKFEENEIREIHKKQLKPTINTLILNVICVIISIGFKIIFDISNIIFGVLLGVFLICSLIYLCRIISFRKTAKPAVDAMLTRELYIRFLIKHSKLKFLSRAIKQPRNIESIRISNLQITSMHISY